MAFCVIRSFCVDDIISLCEALLMRFEQLLCHVLYKVGNCVLTFVVQPKPLDSVIG